MIQSYLVWWYGQGLIQAINASSAILSQLTQFFSLPQLVRTWFAPWKNDVNGQLVEQGILASIQANLVSRLVGFVVRSCTIFLCLIVLTIAIFVLACALLVWLLVPLSIVIVPALAVVVVIDG